MAKMIRFNEKKIIRIRKNGLEVWQKITFVSETEKALCIFLESSEGSEKIWLPKSTILFRDDENGIIVENWILEKKGIWGEDVPPLEGSYQSLEEMEEAKKHMFKEMFQKKKKIPKRNS